MICSENLIPLGNRGCVSFFVFVVAGYELKRHEADEPKALIVANLLSNNHGQLLSHLINSSLAPTAASIRRRTRTNRIDFDSPDYGGRKKF